MEPSHRDPTHHPRGIARAGLHQSTSACPPRRRRRRHGFKLSKLQSIRALVDRHTVHPVQSVPGLAANLRSESSAVTVCVNFVCVSVCVFVCGRVLSVSLVWNVRIEEPATYSAVTMVDVAALVIGVVLFVLLSPGAVLQIPGEERPVEFTNQRTSLPSVIVHAVVFALVFWLLQLLFHIHGGA